MGLHTLSFSTKDYSRLELGSLHPPFYNTPGTSPDLIGYNNLPLIGTNTTLPNLLMRGRRWSRRKNCLETISPPLTTNGHSELGGVELTPKGPIPEAWNFSNTAIDNLALIMSFLRQNRVKHTTFVRPDLPKQAWQFYTLPPISKSRSPMLRGTIATSSLAVSDGEGRGKCCESVAMSFSLHG